MKRHPIVADDSGVVVQGNSRLMEAKKLGVDKVLVAKEEDLIALYKRISKQTISNPEEMVEQMVKRFYSTLRNGIEVLLKEGYINPEDSVEALLESLKWILQNREV